MPIWVLGLLLCCQTQPTGAVELAPKIDLGEAALYFPRNYHPTDGRIDLVVHLHGAEPTVERAWAESGWNCALLVVNRPGLSAAYTKPFSDPRLLGRLLEKVRDQGRQQKVAPDPKIGRLVVSSFSAGFGGVRELLKVPDFFEKIGGLVLADSLYCGYDEKHPADHQLDPSKMADFRRFASEAAAGKKTLLVTHSAQVPEGYGSTTETANDLIAHVGGRRETFERDWGDSWKQMSRFAQGRFVVLGFSGSEGNDHLRHLRRLGSLWKAMPNPFDERQPSVTRGGEPEK